MTTKRCLVCTPGAILCPDAVALWDAVDEAYRKAQRRGFPEALWREYEAALKAYHAHVETCAGKDVPDE